MRFAKGHGTGNDFVILPDPDGALDLTPDLVVALCDRRRGIGGDGVLRLVRADAAEGVDWFMDYRNGDGSDAEMCGNGARVFVRYLLDEGLARGPRVAIGTRTGVVIATVGDEISVAMRRPTLYGHHTVIVGGCTHPGVAVDVGNPHLVCRVPDLSTVDLRQAPRYERAVFPDGVNVEVITGDATGARMRVFERGSGETLSCGTGACAVAAVVLAEAGRDSGTVPVYVPGGRLTVMIDADACRLAGPAVIVAHGEVDEAVLRRPLAASTG